MHSLFRFMLILACIVLSGKTLSQTARNSDNLKNKKLEFNDLMSKAQFNKALKLQKRILEIAISNGTRQDVIEAQKNLVLATSETNNWSEANKLGLNFIREYCEGNNFKNENCKYCNEIYLELSQTMITCRYFEKGIEFYNKQCGNLGDNHYYYLARYYLMWDKPDEGLQVMKDALEASIKEENDYKIITAYTNLALIQYNLRQYQASIDNFNNAQDHIKKTGERETMFAVIEGNKAGCYLELGEYDKAYELMSYDFEKSKTAGDSASFINANLELARIDFEQGAYQKCINRIVPLEEPAYRFLHNYRELFMLELLTKSSAKLGKTEDFIGYYDKWMSLKDTIVETKIRSTTNIVSQVSEYSFELVQKELEQEKRIVQYQADLKLEKSKQREMRSWLFGVGSLSAGIVLLLFFFRFRNAQKQKMKQKEHRLAVEQQEKEILNLQMQKEKMNVKVLSLEILEKEKLSEKILQELERRDNIPTSEKKGLELFLKNELDVKSSRAEFEAISSHFYDNLKERYPKLTDRDLSLAGMVAMKMSNKEIGISKNMSPETVRNAKYRLKKKMNLPNNVDFTEALIDLM